MWSNFEEARKSREYIGNYYVYKVPIGATRTIQITNEEISLGEVRITLTYYISDNPIRIYVRQYFNSESLDFEELEKDLYSRFMFEMKESKVEPIDITESVTDLYTITGRGKVLVVNLEMLGISRNIEESTLRFWNESHVLYQDKLYLITGIEVMSTLTTNTKYNESAGFIVKEVWNIY